MCFASTQNVLVVFFFFLLDSLRKCNVGQTVVQFGRCCMRVQIAVVSYVLFFFCCCCPFSSFKLRSVDALFTFLPPFIHVLSHPLCFLAFLFCYSAFSTFISIVSNQTHTHIQMHTYIYLYSCMYNENNKQAKTKTTKKRAT